MSANQRRKHRWELFLGILIMIAMTLISFFENPRLQKRIYRFLYQQERIDSAKHEQEKHKVYLDTAIGNAEK